MFHVKPFFPRFSEKKINPEAGEKGPFLCVLNCKLILYQHIAVQILHFFSFSVFNRPSHSSPGVHLYDLTVKTKSQVIRFYSWNRYYLKLCYSSKYLKRVSIRLACFVIISPKNYIDSTRRTCRKKKNL